VFAVCTATDNGADGESGKWIGAGVADRTDVEIGGRAVVSAIDWAVVETVDREGAGDCETGAGRAGVWDTSCATVAVLLEMALVLTRDGGGALTRAISDGGEFVLVRGFGGALVAKRAIGAISAGGGEVVAT